MHFCQLPRLVESMHRSRKDPPNKPMWWHSSQALAQTDGPYSPCSLTSPENEASHDVVIQIGRPITQLSQHLAPPTDILDDEGLGGAERVAGEGVAFLRICVCYLSVVCKTLSFFYSMLCCLLFSI